MNSLHTMYQHSYPTWFGQGPAPQFYQSPVTFSPSDFAPTSASPHFTSPHFGGQAYTSAFPTWFGSGPAPEFYKPADHYRPFEHGAGVHSGFHSGLQSFGFQNAGGAHTTSASDHAQTIASYNPTLSSAFPTWLGQGPQPEYYKPPAQFDFGYGQFGAHALGGHAHGGHAFGGHSLSHVVGHSGLGQTVGATAAYPTWLGGGPVPDFYKPPAQFDHTFGHHQQHHQFAPQAGISQVGQHQHQQGHAFIGGVPGGVDAQHHRLMNELRGFQWVGHGFHSGLRGPGALVDSATGPRDLPQDPTHAQLMQEVRHFESHDQPGQHPGLKGPGTAIDQAAGPKDLPDDPAHKKLMEEVRKHSK